MQTDCQAVSPAVKGEMSDSQCRQPAQQKNVLETDAPCATYLPRW